MIVDDERISRFIGNVAGRLGLSYRGIESNGDLLTACEQSNPDVILLAPKTRVTLARNVIHKLAEQHTDAAIILAGKNSKQMHALHAVGASLGLNLVGALPDVFDADTLKRELVSVFQSLGTRFADLRQNEGKC